MLAILLLACSDVEDAHDHDHDHNHGVIAAVELAFTPASGGDTLLVEYHDGTVTGTQLVAGETYDLAVTFYEEDHGDLVDMTDEIVGDAEAHQVFFLGDDVVSPATASTDGLLTIDYNDADADGLPIGLDNLATGSAAGTVSLQVVLQHMPPENDVAVKTEDAAATVAASGLSAIGGEADVNVEIDIEIVE